MRRIRQVSQAFLPVGKLGLGLSFGLHAVADLVPVWLDRCCLTQNLWQRYWTQLTHQTGLEEAGVARPGPTYPRCLTLPLLLLDRMLPSSAVGKILFERTTTMFELYSYNKTLVLRTEIMDTVTTHK